MFILYIFNFGYLLQHLGAVIQIMRLEKKGEIELICLDTQFLFLVGAISRIIWIHDTMLKDSIITYVEQILALMTISYTIYLCLFKLNKGFIPIMEFINKKDLPFYMKWWVLLLVSLILSFFFFPGNDGQRFDLQQLVSLTIFSESMGLLPQIHLVNKQRDSQLISKFYLLFLSFSRIFRLVFWIYMYLDDNTFIYLMIADIIHCVMVSGFVYTFFKNFEGMSLPTTNRYHDESKRLF